MRRGKILIDTKMVRVPADVYLDMNDYYRDPTMRVDVETLERMQEFRSRPASRRRRRRRSFVDMAICRNSAAGTATMPLLEVKDLDKTFTVDKTHLRDRTAVAVDRRARIRLHRRAFGLRQEHVPAHRRRFRACDRRRDHAGRPADRRARPRPRHDVPGAVAVPLADRDRERRWPLEMKGLPKAERARQGARNISIWCICPVSPTSIPASSAAE